MNKNRDFNAVMTYTQLILIQLDRVMNLSTQIQGMVQVMGQGRLHMREKDKFNAYCWSIRTLESMIADDQRDDKYNNEYNRLITHSDSTLHYWEKRLFAVINLLSRKGILYDKKAFVGDI